jgi:acyl-CoA thioesterase-1
MASMAAAYGLLAAWQKAAWVKMPGMKAARMKIARMRIVGARAIGAGLGVLMLLAGTAAPAAAATPRLLILGDSLSAGYGLPHADSFEAQLQAALHAKGKDVTVVDGAVSGDTSAGGRARLDWTIGDGVDAAIVELGANDGLRGVDPAVTEKNLIGILDALAARHIPVLLTGMYAMPNLGPDYAAAFRAVFERLATRPGVLYDPFFLDGVATVPALNQPDRLHPNADGVRHIVARLLPLVEKLLAEVPPA